MVNAVTLRGATNEIMAAFERMLTGTDEAACEKHSMCEGLGLEGECCPTADGVYLDCCQRECSTRSACAELDGNCCPTDDGTMLDCCSPPKECSAHSKCAELDGDCCPTAEGVTLDCCYLS